MGETSGVSQGWQVILDGFLAMLRLSGASEQTVALRRYQLSRMARAAPGDPRAVTTQWLVDWLGRSTWSLETRRSHCSAARSLFAWMFVNGVIATDPAAALPRVKQRRHLPRPCPEEAIHVALGRADRRGVLMILLAVGQGLRRGELAQVAVEDMNHDGDSWWLTVHGKGDKERVVPLWDDIAKMLASRGCGFVFPGQVDGHVSAAWAGKLVKRLLPAPWTAHSLRHAFATRLWRASGDIHLVQLLLGHASPTTTQSYVLASNKDLRDGLMTLETPTAGWGAVSAGFATCDYSAGISG